MPFAAPALTIATMPPWFAMWFHAVSASNIFIFANFAVNIYFLFIHAHVVHIKQAINPLNLSPQTWLCHHSWRQQISRKDNARETAFSHACFSLKIHTHCPEKLGTWPRHLILSPLKVTRQLKAHFSVHSSHHAGSTINMQQATWVKASA